MPASEAQIRANQMNAKLSTGPKTAQGKEASRGNATTHGLTASKLLPEREAAEVERRTRSFLNELNPPGDLGEVLARHAARMSVRMERCGEHENALLIDHARKALAEFVPPEGASEAEIASLKYEVERRALMDPSPEAIRARKYELAAERGFFRALKEMRLLAKAAREAHQAELDAMEAEVLGSFSQGDDVEVAPEAQRYSREDFEAVRRAVSSFPIDFDALKALAEEPIAFAQRR